MHLTVLVPVGINYDRVIEDVSLVRKLDDKAQRRSLWFVLSTSLRFAGKILFMGRKKRWLRFGYASVNFGKPVSIKQYCQEHAIDLSKIDQSTRMTQVEILSHRLMQEIDDVIPVLPMALLSEVVLDNQSEWLSEFELKSLAATRIQALKDAGAPIKISSTACEGVLNAALNMLQGRGFVEAKDGLLRANGATIDLLKYYANSIAHWHSQG